VNTKAHSGGIEPDDGQPFSDRADLHAHLAQFAARL
jgi:hypothetical protein